MKIFLMELFSTVIGAFLVLAFIGILSFGAFGLLFFLTEVLPGIYNFLWN